jgi:hypothetical protein
MDAERTLETSVNIYLTARQYIPEDSNLHARSRDNLKSHKFAIACPLVRAHWNSKVFFTPQHGNWRQHGNLGNDNCNSAIKSSNVIRGRCCNNVIQGHYCNSVIEQWHQFTLLQVCCNIAHDFIVAIVLQQLSFSHRSKTVLQQWPWFPLFNDVLQ